VPHVVDHIWFLLLSVLFPLYGRFFGYARLLRAAPEDLPRVRRRLYRSGMLLQWTLTALTLAIWVWAGRPADALGLVPHSNSAFWATAVVIALGVLAGLVQRKRILGDPNALARIRRQFGSIERMIPHDREELSLFLRLSLTAGICEELLYRGYVICYLAAWMPSLAALFVASAIFGIGHSYQGASGVVKTGLIGLGLGAIYLYTRSLYLGMIMHALIDMYSGHLGQAAFSQPAEARVATAPGGAETPTAV